MYYVLIAIVVAVIFLLVFAATRPASFVITRSVRVNAPASKVFAEVVDFRKWLAWSPWEKLDPATKRSYGGSPSGVGATYAWEGNSKVGAGNIRMTEVRPDSLIRIELNFLKPFKATHATDFTFTQEGTQTVFT